MDTIRVLRVLEYVGPRDLVEEQVRKSIHGERVFFSTNPQGAVTIRAATVGEFPEIVSGFPERVGEGYRLLLSDEIIQATDEIWDGSGWLPANPSVVGHRASWRGRKYRRKEENV